MTTINLNHNFSTTRLMTMEMPVIVNTPSSKVQSHLFLPPNPERRGEGGLVMAGSELKADLWVNEYITPWDIYSHGVSRILAYKKTAFQEMYIVESGAYGKALVLDGKWQSCTGDEFIYHEALVQPAMIAHQEPKTALILGGGEGATTRELLRWKTIEKVMMIDIDGDVVAACKEHLPEMHQGRRTTPSPLLLPLFPQKMSIVKCLQGTR